MVSYIASVLIGVVGCVANAYVLLKCDVIYILLMI